MNCRTESVQLVEAAGTIGITALLFLIILALVWRA